jgi:hypothetical protein
MKKIIFSLSLLLAGSAYNNVNAQLPDGSIAPNFTATDINGVSHNLYDYLNAGKTVIMDISATWCGPCWAYHNSHALADLYNVYGAGGSNEVVVLFIEGDNQTTIDDLHGTGGNTQGDWVTGTPYPIINSGTIANQYDIAGFPTIYRICPNKVLTDIGQPTFAQLKTSIQNGCSVSLAGAQNNPKLEANDMESCTSLVQPSFSMKNYGTNTLTSATVLLKENGTTIQTKNWAGSLASMASETVTFPFISANSISTYTTEVTAVNNGSILHTANGVSQYVVNLAQVSPSLDLTIKVYTDNYPTETSWEMRNSANVIVASGGPYNGDANNGGGADALTTKTHTVTLPNANDCFSFKLLDSYGDGLNTGSNPAGYFGADIEANGETILNLTVGNFGDEFTRIGAFKTEIAQTSGLNKNEANSLIVSPNPSTGNFSIKGATLTSYSTVELVDQLGRTLSTWNINSTSLNIEMNDLANGNYMLVFKGANGNSTQKIQINK